MNPQAPWTEIGAIQQEIRSLRDDISRKADRYELDEVCRRLDSMECSLWEISTSIAGVLDRVEAIEHRQRYEK